jgi:hypothetical protein
MFGDEKLAEIERQQDELVAQSDQYRLALGQEAQAWAQRVSWLVSAREAVSGARWWFLPVAALGGVFAARKWRALVKWAPAALSVWRWVRALRRV